MKCCGCVWHHEMTNRLDFGSDRIKGQGQGHKKVKIVFLRLKCQFCSDLHQADDIVFLQP